VDERGRRKNANDNKIRSGRRIAVDAEPERCRKRILQLGILVAVIIVVMASTTSIPTGNVGVLTLFGRVTGETLGRNSPVNPLKSCRNFPCKPNR